MIHSVGQKIGLYRIDSMHPEKPVYFATYQPTGKKVVLKGSDLTEILTGRTTLDQANDQIAEEFSLQTRAEHPHVCPTIEVITWDETTYLALPHLQGKTLDARLKESITTYEKLFVLEGIAKALAHCHAQGIAHLDVKDQNIMVGKEGEGILIDFGAAREIGKEVQTLAFTNPYVAKEYRHEAKFNDRTDVFSYGIVFWETLTGQHPFQLAQNGIIIYDKPRMPLIKVMRYEPAGTLLAQAVNVENAQRPPMNEISDAITQLLSIQDHLLGGDFVKPSLSLKHLFHHSKTTLELHTTASNETGQQQEQAPPSILNDPIQLFQDASRQRQK